LIELASSQVQRREADPVTAAKVASVGAAIVAGVPPQTTSILQDFSAIKGIGKVFEQRLYKAGIGTYWELANLSDEDFGQVLNLKPLQRARIHFDEVRAQAVNRAQETDTVGLIWEGPAVDDFESIEGIGKVFEHRLYDAGIRTYAALAEASVEELAEICQAPDLSPPDFDSWIAQARRLTEQGGS
jgi:predicted flap endonuclease-1-like 5' DNA nuclease